MHDNIYEWLFEHYALPQIKCIQDGQDDILMQFADRVSLTQRQRLYLADTAINMRSQWGTESFALGIQFGMALAAPRVPDEDCSTLLYFLSQLNDPVA